MSPWLWVAFALAVAVAIYVGYALLKAEAFG